MKAILLTLNCLSAIVLVLLGALAVAAHRAHSYSVYRELKTQNLLNERPDYDVEERLRTIADGGAYSSWIAWAGAGACLANAVAVGLLWQPAVATAQASKRAKPA